MKRTGLIILALVAVPATIARGQFDDGVRRAADRLVQRQSAIGHWRGESQFIGESIAGLVSAYELTGDANYRDAAERGGHFVLDTTGYNPNSGIYQRFPFATETYALARLADIAEDSTFWRDATRDIFEEVDNQAGGAAGFVSQQLPRYARLTSAVYDLARWTVAAHLVDGSGKNVFRLQLIENLADVDNSIAFLAPPYTGDPVLALGAAVWSLASTGDLDDTLLSGSSSDLDGMTLAQLPVFLASHQNTDGRYFWEFGHLEGTGYTEATSLAGLGLSGAHRRDPDEFPFSEKIAAVSAVLANGVGTDGRVYFAIGDNSWPSFHFMAGQTLEVIAQPFAPLSAVVGRHLLYNHSFFDGNDPAPESAENNAVATDKKALEPSQTATFDNYSSYRKGINAIMVDIVNAADPDKLSSADFEFRVGNDNDPSGWSVPPDPISSNVEATAADTHRVTIVWNDNEIENQWLEVTVRANDVTGLTDDDVFYYGNAIGETGDAADHTMVNADDEARIRKNPLSLPYPASINSPFDINRDARVNAVDQLLVRANQTFSQIELQLIMPSVKPHGHAVPEPTSILVWAGLLPWLIRNRH